MLQTDALLSPNGSRLVRFLSELALSDARVSHERFVHRLGRLFDLSDSIAISAALAAPAASDSCAEAGAVDTILADFRTERQQMMAALMRAFEPGQRGRLRFPLDREQAPQDRAAMREACVRFYAAQQRELELRVRNLRDWVRQSVAQLSPALRQLARLDGTLDDTVAPRSRRQLAVVPQLLALRIDRLLEDHETLEGEWEATAARLAHETQGLLLAELDARLLPVLGLIEAIDDNEILP
jgi:hypothetical protein